MKNKALLIVFITFIIMVSIFPQTMPPKREFRGAWIATVANIDWPSGTIPENQKQQLINLLDGLKAVNINAVFFQIRSECDAMYQSNIEPWSYWLTKNQGTPPDPFYDPLKFAIEEAHKRGMELHAWLNPYRAERSVGNYTLSPNHVINKHPDWILQVGSVKFLNPGLKEVRDYVTSVFMDVARRYDVDGIHIDDYFYVEGISNQDAATFAANPRGFKNIADWRRDNVNLLIKEISDSLNSIKPYLKWGVSPRGIWRPGYPPGITGNDNYNSIYCDAMAWLQAKSIDYIAPQLYWPFGGGQDYGKLMPWWADSAGANGRHLYIGHGDYRISSSSKYSASELPNEIRLNRSNINCQGSIHYNTNTTLANPKGLIDSLKNDLYRYPALVPTMNWKDNIKPNHIKNLRFDRVPGKGIAALRWDLPDVASDGDTAYRYAVYKFSYGTITANDLESASNLFDVINTRTYLPGNSENGSTFFVVTALDRNFNESEMSNILEIKSPLIPLQILPLNASTNQRDTTVLKWNYSLNASSYQLQVSTDSTFKTDLLLNNKAVADSTYILTGMIGQQKYYWRIKAINISGESSYSSTFNFTTGFPVVPSLAEPPHASLNVSVNPVLKWFKTTKTEKYRFELATSRTITSQTLVIDTVVTGDTTFSPTGLIEGTNYYWQVAAINQFGMSAWSSIWGFRTETAVAVLDENEIPKKFSLSQNYPNPFNPETQINFSLPESGFTELNIYDILGRTVKKLVSENLHKGNYSINFNGSNLTSGVYIYTLVSGGKVLNRKMILMK